MEPQNPAFRINPETFSHAVIHVVQVSSLPVSKDFCSLLSVKHFRLDFIMEANY